MQYEVTLPSRDADTEYLVACKACTNVLLAKRPGGYAAPEPAAPDCELKYEGVCDNA